jgi:hypothetical protein
MLLSVLSFSEPAICQVSDTNSIEPLQTIPIPVEALATDKAINFQMITDKKFTGQNKFGFFGVANILNTYNNDRQKNEFMVLSMATFQIFKRISIAGGMWVNNTMGVRPTAALNFTQAGSKFLLVYVSRIDLTETHNLENVFIGEFYPRISKNWGLYNRLQVMYNYSLGGQAHDRSYIYLRAGASYRNFRFGLGSNIDYYGPDRMEPLSAGLFLGTQLF